jgi:PiT family inorganic phosphate transporter
MIVITILAAVLVAFANGANDNFKGVASIYGSGTATYRQAVAGATVTTLLGSLAALALSSGLIDAFSGRGFVPPEVVADGAFGAAVAIAAGLTVVLATRFGFPVSTTHALLGGLVGAGAAASLDGLQLASVGKAFVAPLLFSPVVAFTLGGGICFVAARRRSGREASACLCVSPGDVAVGSGGVAVLSTPRLQVGSVASCAADGAVPLATVDASRAATFASYGAGGAICFARALNDTPKIAALVAGTRLINVQASLAVVAVAMAAGGLLFSRRVAEKMAHGVAKLSPSDGLATNAATAGLVLFASKLGLPVSTTHVACGSLFGAGASNGSADARGIVSILAAWVSTLPCAAALGALAYWAARSFLA